MKSPIGKAMTAFLIAALAVLTALLVRYAGTLGLDLTKLLF
jgi:hypothetical protein